MSKWNVVEGTLFINSRQMVSDVSMPDLRLTLDTNPGLSKASSLGHKLSETFFATTQAQAEACRKLLHVDDNRRNK